jgi:ABC-type lipoprotein release transport system permease subunit
LYGVLSFLVTQRRQEIGTRMALGPSKSDVLNVFLGQGLALTVAGLCVGIAGALFVARWLTTLLFGVTPTDPFSFVVVSLVLLIVAGPRATCLRTGPRESIRWRQFGLSKPICDGTKSNPLNDLRSRT